MMRPRSSRPATARALTTGLATLLALFAIEASAESATTPRNLLVILVDTLRADHLGSYGYERSTSPALDRLAGESIVFEAATATSSYTKESVGGLFYGRYPTSGAIVGRVPTPTRPGRTLAEHLGASGYDTACLSLSPIIRGISTGFDERWFPDQNLLSGQSAGLTERALAYLRARDGETPFFLYVHYLDPHAPYAPAAAYRERMAVPETDSPVKLYGGVRERLSTYREAGFGPGDARFEDMVARYDGEIADVDAAVGRLLSGLEELGLDERTLVVFTSDHGEEFLEHGFVDHGWTLFEEVLRVPLFVRAPGMLAPTRIATRVSLADLYPSLLTLLGVEMPPATLDGQVLFRREIDDGPWRFAGRSGPIFSELLLASRNRLRAVIDDDWKYIAAMSWTEGPARERLAAKQHELDDRDADRIGLWSPTVREELYELSSDPTERRDRKADSPQRLEAMRSALARYREHCPADAELGTHAPDTDVPEDVREQLEALGYL